MYEGEIFLIIKMLEVFAVCTPDYYRKAKKKIEDKKLKDIIFFVFSDDINWCIIANILFYLIQLFHGGDNFFLRLKIN